MVDTNFLVFLHGFLIFWFFRTASVVVGIRLCIGYIAKHWVGDMNNK